MISVSVSVDVPCLEQGIRFYAKAFGFEKVSEPYPGVALVRAEGAQLLLLAKDAGTAPCPSTGATRHYDRHWTPVHIDFTSTNSSPPWHEQSVPAQLRSKCLMFRVVPRLPSAAIPSATASASSKEGDDHRSRGTT
jgi:hypothetical protein